MPIGLDSYSGYNFYWQRQAYGVPVQGDGVRIEIDARNGELRNYELQWSKAKLAKPDQVISPSQALQVFADNKMLQLIYHYQDNRVRPVSAAEDTNIKLIYKINHASNGIIDALTGKPYIAAQEEWGYENYAMKGVAAGGGDSAADSLTPEEIKELETSKKIITQEQAAAQVRKWVTLPADAKIQRANLTSENRYENSRRLWTLNWSTPSNQSGDAFDMWASIDAMSGRIYQFFSLNISEPGTGKIIRKEALGQADSFIQKIEPELFKQLELKETEPAEIASDKLPGEYRFEYVRQVNGIPCPGQGINITVSAVDSSILQYRLNWWEGQFPAAARAMSQTQARERYFKYAPLTLTYIKDYNDRGMADMKLVYQALPPLGELSFYAIDAENGERLSWDGKPIYMQPAPRSFTDISDHFAAREIKRLGQAGLFNEYGSLFKPDKSISLVSFLRALMGARDGIWNIQNADDAEILKRSRERGWLTEKLEAESTVSRELMCKIIIRSMNLDYIAKNSHIFVNPFPQDSSLTPDNLGYAALCESLKLLHLEQNFTAGEAVSRGESAYALVRSVQLSR